MHKRDVRLPVLLTQAERDQLQEAADDLGIGASALLRMEAFKSPTLRGYRAEAAKQKEE